MIGPGDRVEYVGPVITFRGTHGTVQGPAYQGRLYVLWDGQTRPATPDRESLRLVKPARDGFRFARCQCDDLRAKLERAYEELAELRGRDMGPRQRAELERRAEAAERRAEAAEREAREAKAKLARIGQVIA